MYQSSTEVDVVEIAGLGPKFETMLKIVVSIFLISNVMRRLKEINWKTVVDSKYIKQKQAKNVPSIQKAEHISKNLCLL